MKFMLLFVVMVVLVQYLMESASSLPTTVLLPPPLPALLLLPKYMLTTNYKYRIYRWLWLSNPVTVTVSVVCFWSLWNIYSCWNAWIVVNVVFTPRSSCHRKRWNVTVVTCLSWWEDWTTWTPKSLDLECNKCILWPCVGWNILLFLILVEIRSV